MQILFISLFRELLPSNTSQDGSSHWQDKDSDDQAHCPGGCFLSLEKRKSFFLASPLLSLCIVYPIPKTFSLSPQLFLVFSIFFYLFFYLYFKFLLRIFFTCEFLPTHVSTFKHIMMVNFMPQLVLATAPNQSNSNLGAAVKHFVDIPKACNQLTSGERGDPR